MNQWRTCSPITSSSWTIICASFFETFGDRLQSFTKSDLSCIKSETVGEKICESIVEWRDILTWRWGKFGVKDHPCDKIVSRRHTVVFVMVYMLSFGVVLYGVVWWWVDESWHVVVWRLRCVCLCQSDTQDSFVLPKPFEYQESHIPRLLVCLRCSNFSPHWFNPIIFCRILPYSFYSILQSNFVGDFFILYKMSQSVFTIQSSNPFVIKLGPFDMKQLDNILILESNLINNNSFL